MLLLTNEGEEMVKDRRLCFADNDVEDAADNDVGGGGML